MQNTVATLLAGYSTLVSLVVKLEKMHLMESRMFLFTPKGI